MFVTVAVCTFNRAASLRRTLDSVVDMHVPSGLEWELIIVNNNSTDDTDDVIGEYVERLPVRREFEPQPGLSHARNRAIDAANGEYIVWTDDDVVVDAAWLRAYAGAFRRWPEAVIFGGRIIPRFEPPVPRWVAESVPVLGGPYAVRDCGNEVQPLSIVDDRVPYGANFAIRSKEQRAFRYNRDLGASSQKPRLGDEVDVIARLLASGAMGYWIPEAIVEHCIGQERQTVSYIFKYSIILGETHAYQSAAATAGTPFLFRVPRRLWLRLLKRWLQYHLHRRISAAPIWVTHLQVYAQTKGAIRYWRNGND
jgi:glycosyltransferase involved in cell wall biosynthesis